VPYEVKRSPSCPPSRPFGVFKEGEGKSFGCHPTAEAARKQLRALYAQEASLVGKETTGDGTFRAREVMAGAEAVFTQEADGPIKADIVIIKPGESANRRFYSAEAIRRAVESGFWENSPMYADHPDDMRMPFKRKIGSLIAGLSGTYVGPGGEARGIATFYNREFGKFAMEAQQHVGVSPVHYFKGQRYKATDGHYHERVDEFLVNHSVDFVAFPAAGGKIEQFLPAMESEDAMEIEWTDITREQLEQFRPDLVEAFKAAAAESQGNLTGVPGGGNPPDPTPPPQPEPKPDDTKLVPIAEVQRIATEAVEAALTGREKQVGDRAAVEGKAKDILGKSGLPEPVRNRVQAQILSQATVENVETIAAESIKTAHAELEALGVRPRMSGHGPSAGDTSGGDPKPITIVEAAAESTAIGAFFGEWVNEQAASGKEN
jgi:hypothetical protein